MDITALYKKFNTQHYTPEKYGQIMDNIVSYSGTPWRHMCEAPVFIPRSFANEVIKASEEIIGQGMAPGLRQTLDAAIPPVFQTPSAPDHPAFFIIDYAVAKGKNGKMTPKLIEMQG